MDHLEEYLKEMRAIRSTGGGVAETSYYPPLATLLNGVGNALTPRVRCVINLQNTGKGIPDGGFFTQDQFRRFGDDDPMQGQIPSRGAMEVKPASDDIRKVAESKQVKQYMEKYGQVLVTNFRDFVLLGKSADGQIAELETYSLAQSESEFWEAAKHPRKTAQAHGDRFVEYLKRAMLHAAPLDSPETVAWFLASYAREAKSRIENKELDALDSVRKPLEESLGIEFEDEKAIGFFRSTLVQTLFYGVFSAWVLWSRGNHKGGFNWKLSVHELKVPLIRKLFYMLAEPGQLDQLELTEVLDWTADVLNRVNRPAFFAKFQEEHAVQYFYEPFLQAFDPDLRKELGVWYTPPEIVEYMVARVDTVLREELGIEDGLADPDVYVLDPGAGTGSYVVEVLKKIHQTLKQKGDDALIAADLKKAATERVFGFEILPAPFVVAHLQIGLLLQNFGAPLKADGSERAGVFLTNSLTGWEPPKKPKTYLSFPELKDERDAANAVKRNKPIIVIIGNPPYNAFAGVAPEEEQGIVDDYKGIFWEAKTKDPSKKATKTSKRISETVVRKYRLNIPMEQGGWGIKKFNLDDLYVRFFRIAERRIAEETGRGIICYISNFSWLSDPSFVIMREKYLKEFDKIWIDCLNGDSRETGKNTPDGEPDPSVFSTQFNRAGIRVGTAISLLSKSMKDSNASVYFRHFWGADKRTQLIENLKAENINERYQIVSPEMANRYSFRPVSVSIDYLNWPRVIDLSLKYFAGVGEDRHKALIDADKQKLEDRMRQYFDESVDWETIVSMNTGLSIDVPGFNAEKVRPFIQQNDHFESSKVVPFYVRPFDVQWCFYSTVNPLWRRPRPEYWESFTDGQHCLVTRLKADKVEEGAPVTYANHLCDYHMMPPNSSIIPFKIHALSSAKRKKGNENQGSLNFDKVEHNGFANLSSRALIYLNRLGLSSGEMTSDKGNCIWYNVFAVTFSPQYLSENEDGIKQDWPRIPLPKTKKLLESSAALGRRIADLLNPEANVKGVTAGGIREEIKAIGIISCKGGKTLDPGKGHLKLDAGWGYQDSRGAVMPGRGSVRPRDYADEEENAMQLGAEALGLSAKEAKTLLGTATCDVFLNETAYWKNIPEKVWNYTIGGYQVIKKWLSYREHSVLNRDLKIEEVREVTAMARRIAAIILLQPDLDKNYEAIKENVYDWPSA